MVYLANLDLTGLELPVRDPDGPGIRRAFYESKQEFLCAIGIDHPFTI